MNLQMHTSEDHQKTKDVENKLEESSEYHTEVFLELWSEGVIRLRVFAEIFIPSTLFCRADVEALSRSVASNDFCCLKDFDFLAMHLVKGEGGTKKGG